MEGEFKSRIGDKPSDDSLIPSPNLPLDGVEFPLGPVPTRAQHLFGCFT